jgi:hypothetical protein
MYCIIRTGTGVVPTKKRLPSKVLRDQDQDAGEMEEAEHRQPVEPKSAAGAIMIITLVSSLATRDTTSIYINIFDLPN